MTENPMEKTRSRFADPHAVNSLSLLLSEVLFILLPLIVLTVVLTFQKKNFELFHTPEWSFISTIFFGQILIKIIAAALSEEKTVHWQRIVLLASGLMVLGIVPSLLVLTLVLVSDTPSNALAVAQIALFIISAVLYFVIGRVGQYAITKRESAQEST